MHPRYGWPWHVPSLTAARLQTRDAFSYSNGSADAIPDAITDRVSDRGSDFRTECGWIPSRLVLPARALPNPRSVLQRRPEVCAVPRGGLALPTRLNHAVRSAVHERHRERLSGRLRMPARFADGKCEYGGVCPRLLLPCREHRPARQARGAQQVQLGGHTYRAD